MRISLPCLRAETCEEMPRQCCVRIDYLPEETRSDGCRCHVLRHSPDRLAEEIPGDIPGWSAGRACIGRERSRCAVFRSVQHDAVHAATDRRPRRHGGAVASRRMRRRPAAKNRAHSSATAEPWRLRIGHRNTTRRGESHLHHGRSRSSRTGSCRDLPENSVDDRYAGDTNPSTCRQSICGPASSPVPVSNPIAESDA